MREKQEEKIDKIDKNYFSLGRRILFLREVCP